MSAMLYEPCDLCAQTGRLTNDQRITGDKPCFCRSMRVVETGLTIGQAERAVEAEKVLREVGEALVKLWKHTPKIDNGHCAVCRIGYANWEVDGRGSLKVGKCDRDDCLSHVVNAALAKVKS